MTASVLGRSPLGIWLREIIMSQMVKKVSLPGRAVQFLSNFSFYLIFKKPLFEFVLMAILFRT
jgi:hypothetical protein